MYTGFGTQHAKGVFAFKTHGGALDTSNLTFGDFHQRDFVALGFTPTQIHAQNNIGPILCFSTARAGLDIQIGAVGVELAGEHALEFEFFQTFFQLV